MSTSIRQETTLTQVANDWQPRPALREALDIIAQVPDRDETAVIGDRSLTFQNQTEWTTISVEPVNIDTRDGFRIAEHITIRTPLTTFRLFDECMYSFINIFATTGAIVRGENGQDAVVSRLPVFEGDDHALTELYAPLIAHAAVLQLLGPLCGLYHFQGRKDEVAATNITIPGWDEPSRWGPQEFASAEEQLRHGGTFANAGVAQLTAEFPWEQGAVSAIAGDCTSMLRICGDVAHPSAGSGLFHRLIIQITSNNLLL